MQMKESITIFAVGHVVSTVTEQTDEGWGQVTSRIEILPPYRRGLLGLDQFSHLRLRDAGRCHVPLIVGQRYGEPRITHDDRRQVRR